MALIGKIRKHMWLVIVLLALALAGFIIMDMTNGNNRGSFGNRTTIGKVNGEKIDYMDFQRTEEALYSGSGDVFGRRSSLWEYFVENAIVNKIADASGIGVGSEELAELEFGTNLSPLVQSFYRDPQTGQVNREQLNEIKKAIDDGTVTNPEFANRFNELRKQVIKTQKQNKLNNLVAKALYTPTWYAETVNKINNESAAFEFVNVPFDVVNDSEISVTDEDYSNYIKENAVKYTNKEEVRNIAYLVFDVKPTSEDSMALKDKLVKAIDGFKTAISDSLFVANNNGYVDYTYAKVDDLKGDIKNVITSLSVGDVYGPYLDNNIYTVAKLVGKKVIADSAKASHILRSTAGGDPLQLAAAQKYIDSLKSEINSGKISFKDAAIANSQDPGSAPSGGDLGTFTPGTMVPQFNDAVFNGVNGGIYTVTTQFGVHLIKVEKLIYKTNEMKYKLAYIGEPVIPSEATQNAIEDKVMGILEGTKKLEDLNKVATGDLKLEVAGGIKINDYIFADLGSDQTSRDIIKWAFDKGVKVGDVSPFLYTYTDKNYYVNSKHVIAALKSIDKPGLASVESVKSKIENLVKNKKKGEKIKTRISGTDLSAIAQTFGKQVDTATNVTFASAVLPKAGQEPLVVGKIFAAQDASTVGPIIGNNGVYIVKLNSKTPASSESGALMQKMQLTQGARMQVNFKLIDALKKANKIEDNRNTFF